MVQGVASVGGCTPVTWRLERSRGSASAFHGRPLPDLIERSVWIHDLVEPALVLGSSQRDDILALPLPAGVDVVRRRSGGGSVLLVPQQVLWLDVLIPVGDPLWQDDIGRAGQWLGEVWVDAIGHGATVHDDGMVVTEWSKLVCFAGVGPGEVMLAGKKLVGISQRRTRVGARFQCALYSAMDAEFLPTLLHLSPTERESVTKSLQNGVAMCPEPLQTILERFLARLSR